MSGSFDSLGDRMKAYEAIPRISLTRRLPMIIRVDGKAFHTLTRGLERPWDPRFVHVMQEVAKKLCAGISGAQLGYVQSDEVSVLVRDDMTLQTQPWFGKDLQKIVSVSASIAGVVFSRLWEKDAHFDARAFVLPPAEVTNYFVWRQQDAVRNSIEALGQAHFSARELHRKSCNEIQEMLYSQKGVNWNDVPSHLKRGACALRQVYMVESSEGPVERSQWVVDLEVPTFTQQRGYIENLLGVEEGGAEKGERP